MRRVVLAAFMVLLAGAAWAENVRVLSGEHADFSRIVLIFGKPVGWRETATADGFDVRFDRTDFSPNLDRVFDKIPKDRIRDIRYDSGTGILSLLTACRCAIEVFEAGRNTVAIDVRTAPEVVVDAGTDHERPAVAFPFGLPGEAGATSRPGPISALVEREERGDRRALGVIREAETASAEAGTGDALGALEARLLEQLGRAATQGVASISTGGPAPGAGREALRDPPRAGAAETAGHIRARTVFDIAGVPGAIGGVSRDGADPCFGEQVLDVAGWTSDPDPARAISEARRGIVSELDRPSSEQIATLVRAYLALGFGAEARAVLGEYGGDVDHGALYLEMARIVDGEPPSGSGVLSRAAGCDGPGALWSLILHAPPGPDSGYNVQAVLAWFVRLPDTLRLLLGPRVVDNLTASGHGSEAATVRDAIARTDAAPSPELRIMDAEAAYSAGDFDAAAAGYAEVIAESDALTAEAMYRMLSGARRQGRVDPETVLTAEAVAFEYRSESEGTRLLEEVALSWARLGEFTAAWRAWDDIERFSNGRPSPDPVLSAVVSDLIEHGGDGAIMTFLHSDRLRRGIDSLTRDSALALAGWAVADGDAGKASEIIDRFRADNALEFRRLRAGLALLEGEPALALAHLAAEDDSESLAMRARALSQLGDHAAASVLFEQAALEDEARREAWLDGDPVWISELGTDRQRSFVEAIGTGSGRPADGPPAAGDEPPNPVELPPLAPPERMAAGTPPDLGGPRPESETTTLSKSRELIESSRAARAAIVALLEDSSFDLPSPDR